MSTSAQPAVRTHTPIHWSLELVVEAFSIVCLFDIRAVRPVKSMHQS